VAAPLTRARDHRDWIEKALEHEDSNSSRGVYNKAGYERQRRHMLQQCADMIEAWAEGRRFKPEVIPPSMEVGPVAATV
jgi:hypothetical protein